MLAVSRVCLAILLFGSVVAPAREETFSIWHNLLLSPVPKLTGAIEFFLQPREFSPEEIASAAQFLASPEGQQAVQAANRNMEKFRLESANEVRLLAQRDYRGLVLDPYEAFETSIDALLARQMNFKEQPMKETTADRMAMGEMVKKYHGYLDLRGDPVQKREFLRLKQRYLLAGTSLRRSNGIDYATFEVWRQQQLELNQRIRENNFAQIMRLLVDLFPGEAILGTPDENQMLRLDGRQSRPLTANDLDGAIFEERPSGLSFGEIDRLREGDVSDVVDVRWFIRLRSGRWHGIATKSQDGRRLPSKKPHPTTEYAFHVPVPGFTDERYLRQNLESHARLVKYAMLTMARISENELNSQVKDVLQGSENMWNARLYYVPEFDGLVRMFRRLRRYYSQGRIVRLEVPFSYVPSAQAAEIRDVKKLFWLRGSLQAFENRDRAAALQLGPRAPIGRQIDPHAFYFGKVPLFYSDSFQDLVQRDKHSDSFNLRTGFSPFGSDMDATRKNELKNHLKSAHHELVEFSVAHPNKFTSPMARAVSATHGRIEVSKFYEMMSPEEADQASTYDLPGQRDLEVRIKSEISLIVSQKGRVQIPTPVDHSLVAFGLTDLFGEPIPENEYKLMVNSEHSAHMVVIDNPKAFPVVHITADFIRRSNNGAFAVPEVLMALSQDAVRREALELRRAGLTVLAKTIEEILDQSQGRRISVFDLERVFQNTGTLSYEAEPNLSAVVSAASGRYAEYSRFVGSDGRTHIQCESSNELFKELLLAILAERSGIKIKHVSGFSSPDLELKQGQRHRINRIFVDGYSPVLLDAAPGTTEDEESGPAPPETQASGDLAEAHSDPRVVKYALELHKRRMAFQRTAKEGKIPMEKGDLWLNVGLISKTLLDYLEGSLPLHEVRERLNRLNPETRAQFQDAPSLLAHIRKLADSIRQRLHKYHSYAKAHPKERDAWKYISTGPIDPAVAVLNKLMDGVEELDQWSGPRPGGNCEEWLKPIFHQATELQARGAS